MNISKGEKESIRYERLLNRITNSNQLQKFINSIELTELQLQNELDQFIESRNHIQESKKLELSRTELSTSLNISSNLNTILNDAGSLSLNITAKVRILDIERSRVKLTLDYVSKVKTLRNLILATNSNIELQNWKFVCESIDQIRKLPLNGEFINTVVPSTDVPESPSIILNKWIEELTEIFIQNFEKASNDSNVENLTFYFQLFPLLGKSNIGLDCYSKFICNIISSQNRLIINNQSLIEKQDKLGFFPAALTRLLEIVAKIINQHSNIIVKYYGLKSMKDIIFKIQKETDSQSGLIIDIFYDYKKIDSIINNYINKFKFNELNKNIDDNDQISIVKINELISEFSKFLKYWSMYCKFITIKFKEYNQDNDNNDQNYNLPKFLIDSKFSKKLNDKILPSLEKLIIFFVKKSLVESFQLVEFTNLSTYLSQNKNYNHSKISSPDPIPIVSIVEDLIMILSFTFKSILETGQFQFVKSLIVKLKNFVEIDYLLVLNKHLKQLYPKSNTKLSNDSNKIISNDIKSYNNKQSTMNNFFQRGASALNQLTQTDNYEDDSNNNYYDDNDDDDVKKLHKFIILLNTLQIGIEYFDKLSLNNDNLITSNFPFDSDSIKLSNNFNNLNQFFQTKSKEFIDENLTILFNQIFKSKLKTILNDFFKENQYLISSGNLINERDENLTAFNFIKSWNQLIVPYIKVLHPKIYDDLLKLIVSSISLQLEQKLWNLNQNINELGSIKLEKDISTIISEVTKSKYHLRDYFLKITQIIMVLGFDREEDDDQLELNWVLTPIERKKARSLRVD
ncbi:hypothetical protein WICMUC_002766 [Wickerhamomyces mucosus]|uniref:Conserved oligomeric Golgi complex subunit 4 n=1 Tax=Wickerhamomyces mucosus TaxID=1378264 RepID=A0A9P8TE00_9ASCO|nr:hypothetical protein WICMUC_002766 [Wickerhamomyces mucosus]